MATAIVTALLAVVVFVLTQSLLKLVLEPLQEQRRLVGEVAAALTVYERAFTLRVEPSTGAGTEPMLFGSSRDEAAEAAKALRDLSGRLQAGLWAVPLYDLFAPCFASFQRRGQWSWPPTSCTCGTANCPTP